MKHIFVLACALGVAGLGFAQECPGDGSKAACEKSADCEKSACDKADKACDTTAKAECAKDLAGRIVKLEGMAAKGCPSAKMKLARIVNTAGAKDMESLKARVAAFETYAPKGCDVSKQVLAKIEAEFAPVAPEKVAMSVRIAKLATKADEGDAKAKETLTALGCGEGECAGGLIAKVGELESHASKGCGESAKQLAALEAKMPKSAPLSLRVHNLAAGSEKGCETSGAALKALGSECGTGCAKTMVGVVEAVEGCAGDGCGMCAMELSRMEAKLASPAAAKSDCGEKAKDSADCTDCSDCTDCTDCSDCGK